jgi:hypothetical protein
MSIHGNGHGSLEYYPCRYGSSRVLFRGPRKQINNDYIAFLGGAETYGRFVERPFPALLEKRLSVACANFGVMNAGVDLYLNDPSIMELTSNATAKVIQITGAHCMSNRYYMVHPRRNDRFLKASEKLEALYPEVDFTEFHFVRHMLNRLAEISAERFREITTELHFAWVARMKTVLTQIRGNTILCWIADHPIPENDDAPMAPSSPLFITRAMIEALRPRVSEIAEIVISDSALAEGTKGMIFTEFEATAAEESLGPYGHLEATDALEHLLGPMLQTNL